MIYTNSPLVSYTRLSPNHSGRRNHIIDTVTVHCVAAHVTVERLGEIFARPGRRASSNYGIGDDGRIALYVDEANRSWCSSSASNDNRAVTIEVSSDSEHPYAVTPEAYRALIVLLADICRRNGIKALRWRADRKLIGMPDLQNMTVHRWFANKACPGDWLYDRHGEIAAEVNKMLAADDSDGDDEEVTQEQFNGMASVWLAEQKKKPAQPYAADALTWAKDTGIMAGDKSGNQMPAAFATREDIAVMLQRLDDLIGREVDRRLAALCVVKAGEDPGR